MCVYIYFSTTHPYRVLFFFFLAGIRGRTFMSRHHILRCSCLARLLNADALSDRLSGKSQDQEMNTREHFGPLNDRTWLRNTHLVSVYLKKVESAQSWCPAHPTTLGWAEDHQATSKTRLMWKELRHSGHFFFFFFLFLSSLSPCLCNSSTEITITGPVCLQEMLVDIQWAQKVWLGLRVWNSQPFSLTSIRIMTVNLKARCRAMFRSTLMLNNGLTSSLEVHDHYSVWHSILNECRKRESQRLTRRQAVFHREMPADICCACWVQV